MHPKVLENQEITVLIDREFVFDRMNLELWLNDLANILGQTKSPIPILLDNDQHSLCFNYNLDYQCWIFSDTNDFTRFPKEKKYYRKLTTQALSDSIFKSFSDNLKKYTVFSTSALAINPDDQLIEAMINLDVKYAIKPEQALLLNNRGAGLLHMACKNGHLGVAIKLLESGANPYQLTNKGHTPLGVAATLGRLDIVKELMKVLDKKGMNNPSKLIYIAASNGHVDILKEFINALQEEKLISQENFINPLYNACMNNHLETVKELLKVIKEDKQLTQSIYKGVTIFHAAAIYGKLEIIQELLKSLKDKSVINQPDNDSVTPFHTAILKNFPAVVEEFLKNGADIDKPMKVSTEKLLQNAGSFKANLRKLFIQENIGKTYSGFTPLQAALFFGYTDILDLLIKNGAKLTSPTQGISLYRLAVAMGNVDLLPPDLQRYYTLAKKQHLQEEKVSHPLRLFDPKSDIKPDKEECLQLLTSSLQIQFEGIKEVTASDGQLTIVLTSPEFAHSVHRILNNTKIKINLTFNSISITGHDITKFMNIYGTINPLLLFAKVDLETNKGCFIS